MAIYLFNTTSEGFDGNGAAVFMTWDSTDGSPNTGCMSRTGLFPSHSALIYGWKTGLAIAVASGDNVSVRIKYSGPSEPNAGDLVFELRLVIGGVIYTPITQTYAIPNGSVDSGWIALTGTMPATGTLSEIQGRFTAPFLGFDNLKVSFDSVYVVDVESLDFGGTELRYLGMAADSYNLYLTGLGNGTLGFLTYSLTTLGLLDADTVFGTATFADVDAGLRGIFPVVRPYSLAVYAHGRDGNSKQVWYNDLGGTAGWVDVGAGTATWGTAKFAVALLPDPLKFDEAIVVFDDNDVYRTVAGTSPWVKQGDVTTNVRKAGRVFPYANQLLLAGTAAGTLFWSQNFGVTYTSGGTAAGTINAIEISR